MPAAFSIVAATWESVRQLVVKNGTRIFQILMILAISQLMASTSKVYSNRYSRKKK